MATIYLGNDMRIELSEDGKLLDEDGDPIEGADIKATMYANKTENEVSGVTWPISLTDNGGGEYSGILPAAAEVIKGQKYDLKIIAEKDGRTATWKDEVGVKERSFSE